MTPFTPGRANIYAGAVNMYWCPLGTKLPGLDIPFNTAPATSNLWPNGWNLIYDTTQAITVHPRNPQEQIYGEFHDLLGVIPAGGGGGGGGGRGGGGGGGGGGGRGGGAGGGGAGVSIAFEILTPEVELWRNMNSFAKTVAAAQTAQRTLTVTAGVSANGNVLITLNGGTPVSVAVLSTDTTASQVATKIAAATYVGWSAAAVGPVVTFTAATPGLKQGAFSATGPTGFAGTFASTVPGHWGATSFAVDHTKQFPIMFGFEMIPQSTVAGSHFWPQSNLRRAFAFQAINTTEPEDLWGKTGRASLLTPNVSLECLPTTVDSVQLAGTGMESLVDVNGRFFYIDTPLTDPAL